MVAVFGRKSGFLCKVVKQFYNQDPIGIYKKMGNFSSRSYSPSTSQQGTATSDRGHITRTDSAFVEAVVCNENDLQDNEMKVFDVGEDGKVLLVKQHGQFSAVGTKCTHYGAPLVNGALGDGRIRCPWHGACFSLQTGDIEDFPGFDSLPCYKVTVTDNGQVKVRARVSDLKENKRTKETTQSTKASPCECNETVVIVGGGPSGATCAETLRSEGFNGNIIMIAKENYNPYDRIKVSKIGTVTDIVKLQARTPEYYKNANIQILKGVEATKVQTKEKIVHLSNGSTLKYTSLYLAPGSKPRVPAIPGIDLRNIFTVRNYQDSIDILTALGDKQRHVVVLGLSFIGLEIAASCVEKAKSLTAIGQDSAPLGRIFGEEIGGALKTLFISKGVGFEFNTTITKCIGVNGELKFVELSNGKTIDADMLILGVGTTFYTDFLRDSGINLEPNGAVSVNDYLETNVKNVYAGGDIAYAPVYANQGQKLTIGHIGLAQYHGRTAALNILKKQSLLHTVPYFWTMVFGKSIRYAGCGVPASSLIDGDVAELKFVVFFFDTFERVIAVASCQRDPIVSQFAEYLHQGKSIFKKDLVDERFAWLKKLNN